MADLHGVEIKLERARHHLNDLHERVDQALDPGRYESIRAIDGEPTKLVYCVRGVPQVDPEWSAILGDYLINPRAALDHLAWQLRPTRRRSADPRHILSPWRPSQREDPPAYQRACIGHLQERHAIRASSPGASSALATQSDFCRIDRHRLLLVLVCMLDVENIWWGLPEGVTSPKVRLRVGGTIRDDDEVAWFDFGDTVPGPDFDPHLALTVRLNEGPSVTRTNPLIGFLEGLRWSVEDHTIAACRPVFTSGS